MVISFAALQQGGSPSRDASEKIRLNTGFDRIILNSRNLINFFTKMMDNYRDIK